MARRNGTVRRASQLCALTGEVRGCTLPHFAWTHVIQYRRQGRNPAAAAHSHAIGDTRPHSDLAITLKVDWPDVQFLTHPTRCGDTRSRLDGNIVVDLE